MLTHDHTTLYAGRRGYTDQPTAVLLDRLHIYRAMLTMPRPGDPPPDYARSLIAEIETALACRTGALVTA